MSSILTNLRKLLSKSSSADSLMIGGSKGKFRTYIIVDDESLSSIFKVIKDIRNVMSNTSLGIPDKSFYEINKRIELIETTLPGLWMLSESSDLKKDRIDRLRDLTGLSFNPPRSRGSVPMVFLDYLKCHIYQGPTVGVNFLVAIFDCPTSIRDKNKMLRRITKAVSEAISKILKVELRNEEKGRYFQGYDRPRFLELFSRIGGLFYLWDIPTRSIEMGRSYLDSLLARIRNELKQIDRSEVKGSSPIWYVGDFNNYINVFNLFTKFKEFEYDDFENLVLELNCPLYSIINGSRSTTFNLDLYELKDWIDRLIDKIGEKEVFQRIGFFMGSNIEGIYLKNRLYSNLIPNFSLPQRRYLGLLGEDIVRIHPNNRWIVINKFFPKIKEELMDSINFFFNNGGILNTESLLSPKLVPDSSTIFSDCNIKEDALGSNTNVPLTKHQIKALQGMIDQISNSLEVLISRSREGVLRPAIICNLSRNNYDIEIRTCNLIAALNTYGLVTPLLGDIIFNIVINNPSVKYIGDTDLFSSEITREKIVGTISRCDEVRLSWIKFGGESC